MLTKDSARTSFFVIGLIFGLSLIGYGSGFAQVAWEHVRTFIALEGKPVAASPPILSEHELEALAQIRRSSRRPPRWNAPSTITPAPSSGLISTWIPGAAN